MLFRNFNLNRNPNTCQRIEMVQTYITMMEKFALDEDKTELEKFLKYLFIKEFSISEKDAWKLILFIENDIQKIMSSEIEKDISPKTKDKIQTIRKSIDFQASPKANHIRSIARTFLRRQISNLESLSLDDLNPNPFLIRNLDQRYTRNHRGTCLSKNYKINCNFLWNVF